MADWRKVMFCDESTSRLVLRGYKMVGRPSGVSRYIIKTVKHPKNVMVWGDFSGDKGREGLYFFPKNVTQTCLLVRKSRILYVNVAFLILYDVRLSLYINN